MRQVKEIYTKLISKPSNGFNILEKWHWRHLDKGLKRLFVKRPLWLGKTFNYRILSKWQCLNIFKCCIYYKWRHKWVLILLALPSVKRVTSSKVTSPLWSTLHEWLVYEAKEGADRKVWLPFTNLGQLWRVMPV